MADLRTDYKDDLLDTSVNTQRKYNVVNNDDGTVSFEDATVYAQNGDTFGASDINAVNQNLTAENGTSFNFAYNEETNEYGYIAKVGGADTFFPFSNAKKLYEALQYSGLVTEDMTFDEMCEVLANFYNGPYYLVREGKVLVTATPYYGISDTSGGSGYSYNQLDGLYCSAHGYYTWCGYYYKIDLTNYKKICVTANDIYRNNDNSPWPTLKVAKSIAKDDYTKQAAILVVDREYQLDVADLTGEYYVRVQAETANRTQGHVRAVELYLQ